MEKLHNSARYLSCVHCPVPHFRLSAYNRGKLLELSWSRPMKHSRSFLIIVAFVLFLLVLLPGLIVQADFGSNWSVTFFNDANLGAACTANCTFTGLSEINFNWGTGSPVINGLTVGVNVDNFSAR